MPSSSLRAAVLQVPVTMDPARNIEVLEELLRASGRCDLVVAPEGVLSGYLAEPDFVGAIDLGASAFAIETAADLARARQVHLIAGACIRENGLWRNSTFCFNPDGTRWRYDKINLAESERSAFTPGDKLPVFDIVVNGRKVCIGVQMCREIRYPEQWRALASQGALIIAYVNNAVNSVKGNALWRAHMVSRAAETQRFVLGANNAGPRQTCPSMIVAPTGETLAEVEGEVEGMAFATLNLGEVSDRVLSQARGDVVRVIVDKHDN